jgi:PAS domain S-box-containing protein
MGCFFAGLRKRTLERRARALRTGEWRESAIFEAALDCVITIDHRGKILEFNAAAERTFGYARSDAIGAEMAELIIPPSLRDAHRRGLAHYLATGEGPILGQRLELSALRADDTEFPVELAVARVGSSVPPVFTAFLRDITERKQTEQALRDSESHYRYLFESNPHPMWIYDLETLAFLAVNDAAIRHYGYAREEFLALTIKDIRPAEDVPELLSNVAATPAGIDASKAWRHRKRDGTLIDVEIVSHPLDFSGKRARLVLAHDVTQRKRAEAEIEALNQRLERRVTERTDELEAARDELERQNTELELQTAELEDQQARLVAANDELEAQQAELEAQQAELEAQQAELERALAELGEEKERIDILYGFGELIASETELRELAGATLTELADTADAELGAVYVVDDERGGAPSLVGVRGLEEERLPTELGVGDGLPGRALAERRAVAASHGETGLSFSAFGETLHIGAELHLPLLHGDRVLGVVTLARVADRPFAGAQLETIEHLTSQAAVAISNALALRATRRQASINRAMLETTPAGIRLADLEGRTVLANATIEYLTAEVFGQPADSTRQERSAVMIPRLVDPEQYLAADAAIAADPEADTVDAFELVDSGRCFERRTRPVYDQAGTLIGRLIVIRETTAEREAQRGLEWARAALEATRDGIGLVDLDGTVLVVNPAMRRIAELHRISLEEGESARAIVAAAAEATTDPEGFLAETATNLTDPERESTYEYQLAGSQCWFQRWAGPFRDSSGALVGRIFTIRESTAERQAEQLKADLLATVSHELRTPLASVLGFAELLSHRELDAETRNRYVGTIYGEARRLTDLINDFLDLQRIEEGQFTLALESFDLRDLAREQTAVFDGQSSAHTLELDAPEEPLLVYAERRRIAQVIANLVSNAIKYSPQGGSVRISAERRNGRARVSVRDSGLGIPVSQQQRIFTKFFRVDSSDTREIGGTGLGLALSREIVEAHAGRVGFESTEGEGSTFWFELAVPSDQERAGAEQRILVVEDNPTTASLLEAYLAEDGLACDIVPTGELALELALAQPPVAILLDIALAGELNGWDVLIRLKEHPATEGLPVIVCTGGRGERAGALGAADVLTKPFSATRLRETMARVLPSGRGSVLVVDDEPAVRELVVETLAGDRLQLREAGDGEEALALIAERVPDAVVLDLILPRLDGFAVLERLKEDPATRDLPVVVLTGKSLSPEERRTLCARTVALVEKSAYSAQELRRLVRNALSK